MSHSSTMLDRAEEYLAYRRDLGFQLRSEGLLLRLFARYADAEGHQGPLTTELAVRWARLPNASTPLYWARRLEVVRCFARFLAISEPRTEIPAKGLLGSAHRRIAPYIYSEAEIAALLTAARQLRSVNGLRPQTYATLLGLLASAGLRISEALRLTRFDFADGRDLLAINETKFHKSRLVPLHPSTAQALREYAVFRDRVHPCPLAGAFFLTDRGTPLRYTTVRQNFRRLCGRVALANRADGRRPRLHDFRHTFACRRLLRWYEVGADVEHGVAALSTYLGHGKVSDTYWYLTATPELLGQAAARFEPFAAPRQGGGR